jgi:hypothetical protein
MEPQVSETAAHRKVAWLAQYWRTFFSIMRFISGWCEHTRISRGVDMPMMGWCTVATSKKRKLSKLSFKPAWRSAA